MRRLVAMLIAALFIAIGLIALVPVDTHDLGPHRRSSLEYASAIADITRRRATETPVVAPGGESTFRTHGRRVGTAVLLLHGLTNSPLQFDSLSRLLYADGDNVYVPRLPHHAQRNGGAAPLARITAEELCAAADTAMDLTAALGDTVVVVGLSLGGTMAAWIAQYRPEASRVIIIAPLIALYSVPRIFDAPLRNLLLRLPNYTHREPQDAAKPDRELGWSTHAVAQTLRLALAVERASRHEPPASRSIAILLNAHDRTIAVRPVLAIGRRWAASGAAVRIYRLPAALGLPHDIIDPRQPVRRTEIVYPMIKALVRGRRDGLAPPDRSRGW